MYVCVFIDWENLEKEVKQEFGSVLCYQEFKEVIRNIATKNGSYLVGIYAYGDFDKGKAGNNSTLINLGIEPKHVVTKTAHDYLKGSTDIELSLDVLDIMHNYQHITEYLFISGDSDLRHVMKRLKMNGKTIRLASFKENTSQFIIEMANEFIHLNDYPEILRKVTKSEKEQIAISLTTDKYVQKVVRQLYTLMQKDLDFIGLNYFRKRLIDYYSNEVTQMSDALTECLDYALLNTYQVPNVKDPDHPTTACTLNMDNKAVQMILENES